MSWLSNIFGGGGKYEDPAGAAKPYLDQIPGVGHTYYDPYIDQGHESGKNVHGQYENLMNDPQGFIDALMKNYKTSEGYNYAKDELGRSMSNTAAAGGIAGTPFDQKNQATQIQGLLSKDQQQYLENALGVYGRGLKGEEGESERGYNASGKMTDLIGGALNQQGGLAFNSARSKNAQNSTDRNAVISALMKALGMGVGFAAGGPAGAMIGGGLGSDMFGGG